MDHAGQDARRILDEFPAAQLNIVRVEENRLASQLAHAHFERDPRPGRGLGKDERPGLPAQRKVRVFATVLFLQRRNPKDVFHLRSTQLLDAKKILHPRVARASRALAPASRRRGLSLGA